MPEIQPNDSKDLESALARWPVFLAGTGFGLLAAYILDPQHGHGRRTKMKHHGFRFGRRAARLAGRRWRELNHRVHELYHELTHREAATVNKQLDHKVNRRAEREDHAHH